MYKQKHGLPFRSVWWRGNGYAWQTLDFLDHKHDLVRRSAQWNMFHVGMTICGRSSWEHPCILHKFWNREQARFLGSPVF